MDNNMGIIKWNRVVIDFMQTHRVDMETALLYLQSNNYDVNSASLEYKRDLKACGK